MLDPFWFTKDRGSFNNEEGNWARTLGEEQYQWLRKTLAGSKAKFKFVFLYHLVGGIDRIARGGIAAAKLYEWGEKNADGSDGFKQHRPGREMPIHQLRVKHLVSAVFHGHDHLFAKEDLDGISIRRCRNPAIRATANPTMRQSMVIRTEQFWEVPGICGWRLVSAKPKLNLSVPCWPKTKLAHARTARLFTVTKFGQPTSVKLQSKVERSR